jgi:protein-S-isoprenylcysteine O-methyltransferase Ste14
MEDPAVAARRPPSGWRRGWERVIHYRIRISFFLFAGLLGYDVWIGLVPHDLFSLSDPLGPLGGVVVLGGLLLRSWAAGVVHKNQALAVRGPYSLTRHPLYVGSFLTGLGVCLVIGDARMIVALAVLFSLIYLPKMRAEERSVSGMFAGPWADYARRTGLVFPRRFPRLSGAGWCAGQWAKNGEYRAFATGLAVLAVLQALHLRFA